MRSTLLTFALTLLVSSALFGTCRPAHAQILSEADLQLIGGSEYLSGCAPPSICDCLVIHVGDLTGTFHLTPLLPPLLPFVDYAVEDIDWEVDSSATGPSVGPLPSVITGSGLYTVDVLSDSHSMELSLQVDGVDRDFTSGGFVPMSDALAAGLLGIYVYDSADPCLVDGLLINALVVDGLTPFRRGDCNTDGAFDIGDPINMLDRLFSVLTVLPPCRDACDSNDDGLFDIADTIFALSALFAGGAPPPPPFMACGIDPTVDALGCFEYPPCAIGTTP